MKPPRGRGCLFIPYIALYWEKIIPENLCYNNYLNDMDSNKLNRKEVKKVLDDVAKCADAFSAIKLLVNLVENLVVLNRDLLHCTQ